MKTVLCGVGENRANDFRVREDNSFCSWWCYFQFIFPVLFFSWFYFAFSLIHRTSLRYVLTLFLPPKLNYDKIFEIVTNFIRNE